jgi:PAS domain S-box-containing protein
VTHGIVSEREGALGLRATIDFAPIGIAHFDTGGRFLLVNDKLCEILGHSREDLLSRTFQEITYPDDLGGCIELNKRLAAREIPSYTHEKRFVRMNGSTVWVRISVSSVHDSRHPGAAFFIGIAEDISEQRGAQALAERAVGLRDEMMAIVAHDLRTPLQTIVVSAAALEKQALDAERRARLLAMVQRTARKMDSLLTDLLDVSRIEAGRLVVNRSRVDVTALLREACDLFESLAHQANVTLACDVDPALPHVAADPARLLQALLNILSNALKFTPRAGRILLQGALGKTGGVRLSVTDTGAGISPEHLGRVFDRFWQADRTAGVGAGLGLTIARGIVEAHGGRIWAESAPGRGTTIAFEIPE